MWANRRDPIRVPNKGYDSHTHVTSPCLPFSQIENRMDSFETLGEALETWIHRRSIEKSIFLTVDSYKIALGSFFLPMPTRDGRQALVIFPPGETSLEDIRHMYELRGDEELPQVQTLRRVLLEGKMADEGCNCILSDC